MIDLYAMGSPNVVKVYIALEEMGLPYTVHPVDVFGEGQFKPEFLRLNPVAKVPVITDHDGPGGTPYTLFESGAILLYLAEKTGQFVPKDPIARFNTIQWMMVSGRCSANTCTSCVLLRRVTTTPSIATARRCAARSKCSRNGSPRCRSSVERAIRSPTSQPFPWARNVGTFLGKPAEADYPKLIRWVASIAARPAVARALAAVDDVRTKTTQFDNAGAEAMDRLFGRGRFAA